MKVTTGSLGIFLFAASLALDALAVQNYPAGIDYPERAITRRESSYDRDWENGNADARQINPGETLTIAEMEGPGRITHIWFTSGPVAWIVTMEKIEMKAAKSAYSTTSWPSSFFKRYSSVFIGYPLRVSFDCETEIPTRD